MPERYFAEIDRLLGDYRRLAEQSGAVLMLASDHGFHWREGRPATVSSAAAATAGRWHREDGIYLLHGPGIAPSAQRGRGTVGQVAATLLALLGLPPGQGMEGPPLPGTPAGDRAAEPLDYRAFYHPAAPADGGDVDAEAVAKLRSLGYVGTSEGRSASAAADTRTAASWNNEGLLRRERGETAAASAAFERALALESEHAAALWNLSDLLAQTEPARSDELLGRALAAGLTDGVERTAERALAAARAGNAGRARALLDAAFTAGADTAPLRLLSGRLHLDGQRCREALADFERAAALAPTDPVAPASAGLALLCLGDEPAAARHLRRSLALDPAQPAIREALSRLP